MHAKATLLFVAGLAATACAQVSMSYADPASYTPNPAIPGGCNPAHPGSCPSSYFATSIVAPTPAPSAGMPPKAFNHTMVAPVGPTGTGNGVHATTTGAAHTTGGQDFKGAAGKNAVCVGLLGGIAVGFTLLL